jgi:hypothetical protein
MFGFFKKKKTVDELIADTVKAQTDSVGGEGDGKRDDALSTGNAKLDIELTKIKAQIEGFAEVRKANSERFQRMSEQVGELRGMIMDTNKSIGEIEVKATKASDLVSSVQPEKLMIDVRKAEGKVDALHANIESNDTMLRNIMDELKIMRNQMKFYKGIEQVIALNDDVKKELMEMKKIEASAKRHADKIDTIFIDVNRKFSEFDKFNDVVKEIDRSFKVMQGDFDKIKVSVDNKEDKKEFINLVNKFNEFEKHTTNIINLLDKKSKTIKKDLGDDFEKIKSKLEKKFDVNLKDTEIKADAQVEIKKTDAQVENKTP